MGFLGLEEHRLSPKDITEVATDFKFAFADEKATALKRIPAFIFFIFLKRGVCVLGYLSLA